jgi:hypothetical protein
MGYTHYWYRGVSANDPVKFAAFAADCERICKALAIPLGDGSGENEPVFRHDLVAFNGHVNSGEMMPQSARVDGLKWPVAKAEGVADWQASDTQAGSWFAGPQVNTRTLPESGDGSYESFIVEPVPSRCFDCCKTNYHPYDLAVQCCLVALKEHYGNAVAIRSDGEPDAWKEPADICQHVLGYGLLFELDGKELTEALDKAWEAKEQASKAQERQDKYGNYPPITDTDRNSVIKRIRQALRKRTGRDWSVRGGRGTAYGWITIDAPPRRCTWHHVNTGKTGDDGMPIYDEVDKPGDSFGHMGPEDRLMLASALGFADGKEVNTQGTSIPASSDYYIEYIDRAEGREPRACGQQYWD